jgi:hypothetical protein
MNVAVVEPAEGIGREATVAPAVPAAPVASATDWIDPEGDDWLAANYRFLIGETPRAHVAGELAAPAEVEHWFG